VLWARIGGILLHVALTGPSVQNVAGRSTVRSSYFHGQKSMSTDFGQWDRVASELRACREAQQEAWGDVDNAMLGRYLADDVTPQERRRIEKDLEHHPELRKLTDLVSDVLRDCEVASPQAARASVLSFPAANRVPQRASHRWRQWVAVAAAACLLLALGYTVLPRGASPSSPFRGSLANVTPVSLTITNKMALRDTLTPGDSARDNHVQFAGKDDRADAKKNTSLEHVAIVLADQCATAAETYHKHGDLDMAEFSYKLAYNIRDWKFGPEAEPTVEARRNLGDVYQTALNLDAVASTQPAPPAPEPVGVADRPQQKEIQVSADRLRKRLEEQPVESIVPVLAANLNEAKTPAARLQLSRALANLRGAGKGAVPALEACLQKKDLTNREREAVREAKERLESPQWPIGATAVPGASPAASPP
jgi:hypothetical protein